ncbi:MAG: hypothetical protein GDA68_21630 [Nitrospira sp. CR2.1]|nr:hypothetical protein [Nitrospira sp. CR2.1]MBA5873001.1 hypothetical protein [Nitrospira sp. CR1.2]
MNRELWLHVAAMTGGIVVRVLVSVVSHTREAWDSDLYFTFGLPAFCAPSAMLGYLEPDKSWRWGAVPLAGEMVCTLLTQGPGNLFPLGIVMFGIIALPSIGTAQLGALLGRKRRTT